MLADVLQVELKQTRFYQDVFAEGRQEGKLEGKLEGRQEGQREGRQESEQALLRRLLTRRFGPLPDWGDARLKQATTEQLEHWAEKVLDAPTLPAVFEE